MLVFIVYLKFDDLLVVNMYDEYGSVSAFKFESYIYTMLSFLFGFCFGDVLIVCGGLMNMICVMFLYFLLVMFIVMNFILMFKGRR